MNESAKKDIIGVHVNSVGYDDAVARIMDAARRRVALGVSALAVHGLMEGAFDPEHRYRLNALHLVVPDGTGILWGLKLLHKTGLAERVRGPGLMLRTCAAAVEHGLPIFLFGSTRSVLEKLCESLLRRFPGLRIAGIEPSRFRQISDEEDRRLIDRIASSGAAVLFVGLGCPRQEVWVFEHLESLQMPMLAVGAAFAMHAGVTGEAPVWMQRHALEWLYRLWREPRLWRRNLLAFPYLALIGLQKFGVSPLRATGPVSPAKWLGYG